MRCRFPNHAGIPATDTAKRGFQILAAAPDGEALYNWKFSRPKLERFPGDRSPGPVAMEVCSTVHAGGASRRPRTTTFVQSRPSAGCGMWLSPTRTPDASGPFRASGRSTAAAFPVCAPEMTGFRQGQDFPAWPRLVPNRHSTGGKTRPTNADQTERSDMRRPLVGGAAAAYPPRRGIGSARTVGSRAFADAAEMGRDGRRRQDDGPT